jgi:hypothetical protein
VRPPQIPPLLADKRARVENALHTLRMLALVPWPLVTPLPSELVLLVAVLAAKAAHNVLEGALPTDGEGEKAPQMPSPLLPTLPVPVPVGNPITVPAHTLSPLSCESTWCQYAESSRAAAPAARGAAIEVPVLTVSSFRSGPRSADLTPSPTV